MTDDFSDPSNWHPIEEHPYLNDPPKVTPIPGMTDDLHARIKEEVLDGILSMFSENDPVEMAAGYIADAVIRELQLTVLGDGIVVGVIHE